MTLTATQQTILATLSAAPAPISAGRCYPAGMNGNAMLTLGKLGLVRYVKGAPSFYEITDAGRAALAR